MCSNGLTFDRLTLNDVKSSAEQPPHYVDNAVISDSNILPPSKRGGSVKKSPFGQLLDAVRNECSECGITWTDDLQRDLPKKWEKHGSMILLPENSFSNRTWRLVGRKLWSTVAESLQCDKLSRKRRIENDDYRTPHIELLFGPDGWVEHVDNGVKYQYDVTKCMFSIGNISEKLRIANFDCRGETVVDLFAGIGYFTLPYLIHAKAAFVYACEWNPDAIEALKRNLIVNKVDQTCKILEGDCRKVCPVGVADRVNMGLLPTTSPYWLTGCRALKSSGGYLHIHENVNTSKLKKFASCDDAVESAAKLSSSPAKDTRASPNTKSGKVPSSAQCLLKKHVSLDASILLPPSSVEKHTEEKNDGLPEDPIENGSVLPKRRLSQTIEEEMALLESFVYQPLIDDDFKDKWSSSSNLEPAYREFAELAAGKIFKYMNNLHCCKFQVKICYIGKIKSYAPRIDHVVLDLLCTPEA